MKFWYRVGHTLSLVAGKLLFSYRVQNREGLNRVEGGLLLTSNHVSFLDPPLVGIAYRTPIYYFARKTLFDHPVMGYIFRRVNAIPVNQARPELSSLKTMISLLQQGEKVLIFPEGERSRDGKLKSEGQIGVGMIVSKARVPVLPVRLFGPEKALPRGSKRVKRHPVTLVVGEPLDLLEIVDDTTMSTKERYEAIARRIMLAIASLELKDDRGE